MSTRVLSITLLLLLMCSVSSAQNWRHPSRRWKPCCIEISTANITNKVIGDTYQKPSTKPPCVEAIILTTKGGQVCVDPKSEWVQQLTAQMRKV